MTWKINKKLLFNGKGVLIIPTVEGIIKGIKEALSLNSSFISNRAREYVVKHYNWYNLTKKLKELIK